MADQKMTKAVAVAVKIAEKAEATLASLDREMTIMKWPPEFRAIMWNAVAVAANVRASECGTVDEKEVRS